MQKDIQRKQQKKKESTSAQKQLDLARVRGFDIEEMLKYDLVSSSSLFDQYNLMSKPVKSSLVKELEKQLNANDYFHPKSWKMVTTACIVDVMGYIRRLKLKQLKTFGELCEQFISMVSNIHLKSTRIDFVFDSYLEGSIKDSERERRSKCRAIDLNYINFTTPLPVDLDAFWASNSNKCKLQELLSKWLISKAEEKLPNVEVVLSAFSGDISSNCQSVLNGMVSHQTDLNLPIEEADARIIPHTFHAAQRNYDRVIILSSDTDVLVLLLHYWTTFHRQGLKELWMRAGIADTTRYLPVHTLATNIGPLCSVLPALHALSGCDTTSKVGTKAAALKANPTEYLLGFGKSAHPENLESNYMKAEQYLIQVLKNGSPIKCMDKLRYFLYHQSKNITIEDLPPTSYAILGHIKRAYYTCHVMLTCLDGKIHLDPQQFGYEAKDGLLVASKFQRLIPDRLVQYCSCLKCSTVRCYCRKSGVPCCIFCKCHSLEDDGNICRNPNIALNIPYMMNT